MVETRRTSRRLEAKARTSLSPSPMSSPAGRVPARMSRRTPSPLNRKKKLQVVKELAQEIPIVMTDEEQTEEEHVKRKDTTRVILKNQIADELEKTMDEENCVEQEQENDGGVLEEAAASIAESELVKEQEKSDDEEAQVVEKGKRDSSAFEDEILLLKTGDNEEEDGAEEEEDDEDIDYYASLAASGLKFSIKSALASTSLVSAKPSVTTVLKQQLVPNQLNSGASQYLEFFDFEGSKRAQAATLRADARAIEEAKVLAASQKAVAHSDRQRAESQFKKSAGRRWFNFESEEMTADARRDFALLRMRNFLDPKKFYKSSDHARALPKHFQMGVVIEGAHEFHSARLTKKQRRKTFTDEVMADEAVMQYTNRVASNIQKARSRQGPKKRRHN